MHFVCPHCHAINNLPDDKSWRDGNCGKCHQSLDSGAPVELNDATYHRYIQKNHLPVLIDYWASWCGPCKVMAPTFAQVANESDAILFAKVNTEQAPQISTEAGIRSIPTLILFYQGEEKARISGALQAHQLKQWLVQSIQAIN